MPDKPKTLTDAEAERAAVELLKAGVPVEVHARDAKYLADKWMEMARAELEDVAGDPAVAVARKLCAQDLLALLPKPTSAVDRLADELQSSGIIAAMMEHKRAHTLAEQAALRRCFQRAAGVSGGEATVRRLLFAWYNATELGGFDIADLWGLSDDWREDCLTVIAMVARGPQGWYADRYGFGDEMRALVERFP